jgi:hypothetical protein
VACSRRLSLTGWDACTVIFHPRVIVSSRDVLAFLLTVVMNSSWTITRFKLDDRPSSRLVESGHG